MIGLGYFAIQGGAINEEFTFVIIITISLKQKDEYIWALFPPTLPPPLQNVGENGRKTVIIL